MKCLLQQAALDPAHPSGGFAFLAGQAAVTFRCHKHVSSLFRGIWVLWQICISQLRWLPRRACICKPEMKRFILREAAALNCRSRGISSPLMSAAECGCTGLGTTSKAGPLKHPPSRPRLAGRLYLPPLPIQTLSSSLP